MREERECEYCGKKYIARRYDARFCSKPCSNKWHNYANTHSEEDLKSKPWLKKARRAREIQDTEPLTERECEICGAKFMPRNKVNVFCPECRQLLYEGKKPEKEKTKPKRTAREKAIEETKMQAFADLAGVALGRNYGTIRAYFDRNDFNGLKKIAYKLWPARND